MILTSQFIRVSEGKGFPGYWYIIRTGKFIPVGEDLHIGYAWKHPRDFGLTPQQVEVMKKVELEYNWDIPAEESTLDDMISRIQQQIRKGTIAIRGRPGHSWTMSRGVEEGSESLTLIWIKDIVLKLKDFRAKYFIYIGSNSSITATYRQIMSAEVLSDLLEKPNYFSRFV